MVLRILLFPALLSIFLYIITVQLVPTYKKIQALQITKELKMEELQSEQHKHDAVDDFISSVNAHPSEKDFIASFLPQKQREEIITNDIWQMVEDAKNEDGSLNLFSVGFSDEGAKSGKVAVRDTKIIEGRAIVSGTYEELQKFIEQMFRFDRLYAFKTIDITKPEKDDNEENSAQVLSASITFGYAYAPKSVVANSIIGGDAIDYDLIATVMEAVAAKEPLVAEAHERKNPFLP